MIKIIVVDDHPLFRMAIKLIFRDESLGITVTGEADCGEELFKLPALHTADLILLDINLPGIDGVEITRRLKKEYPTIKVLAVSAENSAETVKSMVNVGVHGFISKRRSGTAELAEAIHSVMNDIEYFGSDIASIIYNIFVSKKNTLTVTSEFTEREKEVIIACKSGLVCKEIADQMGISMFTVNTHKRNIFKKLGINSSMEMVQYALKNGIIRLE